MEAAMRAWAWPSDAVVKVSIAAFSFGQLEKPNSRATTS
jgi:hypothetical protein